MIHDPLCFVLEEKGFMIAYYGAIGGSDNIYCLSCYFIRMVRGDERMSCIEDVEGAYIVGSDNEILAPSHPEYSHDGTDNWNTAISVAVSYLKGLN